MSNRHGIKRGLSTFCPACGSDMHFRKLPSRGSTVTCRQCQSLLEVKRLAPLTLEWAFEEPFDVDGFGDSYQGNRNQEAFEDFELESGDPDDDWETNWEDEDWNDDDRNSSG